MTAFALVLVFEGIMPFLSPNGYRSAMEKIREVDDKTLRSMGLVSMIAGVLLLYLIRQ